MNSPSAIPDGINLTKQAAFDYIDWCKKQKKPILGIEVLKRENGNLETNIYKTIWFKTQRAVYSHSRNFIQKQMAGEWLWAEFKH